MPFKRTTFPTKTGLFCCSRVLRSEKKPVCFENADLHKTNWRKQYFDELSCYCTRYKLIWRTGEQSNQKL